MTRLVWEHISYPLVTLESVAFRRITPPDVTPLSGRLPCGRRGYQGPGLQRLIALNGLLQLDGKKKNFLFLYIHTISTEVVRNHNLPVWLVELEGEWSEFQSTAKDNKKKKQLPPTFSLSLFFHSEILVPVLVLLRCCRRPPNIRTTSSLPYITPPNHHPLQDRSRPVNRRPDVQIKHRIAVRVRRRRVIINDVANLLSILPKDVPVVYIERQRASKLVWVSY